MRAYRPSSLMVSGLFSRDTGNHSVRGYDGPIHPATERFSSAGMMRRVSDAVGVGGCRQIKLST